MAKRVKPSERKKLGKDDAPSKETVQKASMPKKRGKGKSNVEEKDSLKVDDDECPFGNLKSPQQRAFLAAYCVSGQLWRAQRAAAAGRWTHTNWMNRDPEYRKAFRKCQKIAADYLESHAFRLAMEGLGRLKFDKHGSAYIDPRTKKYYVEREFSVQALLALLKAAKPKKYRERSESHTTHSFAKSPGPGSGLSDFIQQRAGAVNGHSHN